MSNSFTVTTTTHFDRIAKKLAGGNPAFVDAYAQAITVLASDPYNRAKGHNIRKLSGKDAGEGEFRLRLGRFRFIYSIYKQEVVLYRCALRREDTY